MVVQLIKSVESINQVTNEKQMAQTVKKVKRSSRFCGQDPYSKNDQGIENLRQ